MATAQKEFKLSERGWDVVREAWAGIGSLPTAEEQMEALAAICKLCISDDGSWRQAQLREKLGIKIGA